MQFPNIMYMCNKVIDKKTAMYSNNWKKLNPDLTIRIYDNKMCEKFLLYEFSPLHRNIFMYIRDGPIKADFWRLCILYKYGGIYSDVDNEPLVPLKDFIDPSVDFVTCSSFSNKFAFNPNLILCNKENIIIKKCIEWYIKKYINKDPYGYWEWSVMAAFTNVFHINNYKKTEGIYKYDNMKVQIIQEVQGHTHNEDHNIYKNQRVFNNRYKDWNCNIHGFSADNSISSKSSMDTLSRRESVKKIFNTMVSMYNSHISALPRVSLLNNVKVDKHYMKLK